MRSIRARRPKVLFEGVCGPSMAGEGCSPLDATERLAIIGLVEALRHVPRLSALRRRLYRHFVRHTPDVFVGIDAPDFNLGLEQRLRGAGIPVVHYVSPTVWAWRRYRVRRMARAADLVLTLFPFEAEFLRRRGVNARFTGHPLAARIPLRSDTATARVALGLAADDEVVALLPGSRMSEVRHLAAPFLRTALWLRKRRPGLRFVLPLANPSIREWILKTASGLALDDRLMLVDGRAHEAMQAADAVLAASGTATLEAMLFKRPLVVAYRMPAVSYGVVRPLLRVADIALPNLLAGRQLVPEFLQYRVTPGNLGAAVLRWLENPATANAVREEFVRLHQYLLSGPETDVAEAVLSLADGVHR